MKKIFLFLVLVPTSVSAQWQQQRPQNPAKAAAYGAIYGNQQYPQGYPQRGQYQQANSPCPRGMVVGSVVIQEKSRGTGEKVFRVIDGIARYGVGGVSIINGIRHKRGRAERLAFGGYLLGSKLFDDLRGRNGGGNWTQEVHCVPASAVVAQPAPQPVQSQQQQQPVVVNVQRQQPQPQQRVLVNGFQKFHVSAFTGGEWHKLAPGGSITFSGTIQVYVLGEDPEGNAIRKQLSIADGTLNLIPNGGGFVAHRP